MKKLQTVAIARNEETGTVISRYMTANGWRYAIDGDKVSKLSAIEATHHARFLVGRGAEVNFVARSMSDSPWKASFGDMFPRSEGGSPAARLKAIIEGDTLELGYLIEEGDRRVSPIEGIGKFLATHWVRTTRKGWHVAVIPGIGEVHWKSGKNFRNFQDYFFVRFGGREVIASWPGKPLRLTSRTGEDIWEEPCW